MEKVIRLVNILDDDVIDKLITLDRLVRFYSTFLRMWRKAEVTSDGATVKIRFSTRKYGFENFTERVFPIEDINERICSYWKKVQVEYALRHENPRIYRSNQIHRWKNFIKNQDAKI
jgi:hypothetical protein